MRICIVNEFFWPDTTGGTGTVLSDLVAALRAPYGALEIDVIASRNLYRQPAPVATAAAPTAPSATPDGRQAQFVKVPAHAEPGGKPAGLSDLPARDTWSGANIVRLKTPRPNDLSTPLRLIANLMFTGAALVQLLRSRRYDLVVVATAPPMVAMAASLYKKLTGVPYVYVVYDLEPDRAVVLNLLGTGHPGVKALRRGQRAWFHDADRIVVLGRCMRDYICRAYDVARERVAAIPVGADADEIVPLPRETQFRADNRLTGFVLLYSGNFGRYHDFNTVLDAAKRLAAKRDDVHIVLVGGGAQTERIRERIVGEKIDNVLLKSFVAKDRYADLLASADASFVTLEPGMEGLCVPSKFYSILASGRATIAVVPSITEVGLTIEEAECGLRISHGDTDGLVAAIETLADDPELCARMGRNARRALVEKYATSLIAGQYYQTFVEVLGETGQSIRSATGEPFALGSAADSLEEAQVM